MFLKKLEKLDTFYPVQHHSMTVVVYLHVEYIFIGNSTAVTSFLVCFTLSEHYILGPITISDRSAFARVPIAPYFALNDKLQYNLYTTKFEIKCFKQ
jgi:hypothetical protein